jgi:hypothetical protein
MELRKIIHIKIMRLSHYICFGLELVNLNMIHNYIGIDKIIQSWMSIFT